MVFNGGWLARENATGADVSKGCATISAGRRPLARFLAAAVTVIYLHVRLGFECRATMKLTTAILVATSALDTVTIATLLALEVTVTVPPTAVAVNVM
jgi:hypothetical protein